MNILLVSPLGRNDEWLSAFIPSLEAMGHSVIDEAHFADIAFMSLRWGRQDYSGNLVAAIQHRLPFAVFDFMDYLTFTGRSEWFEWGLSPNFCRLAEHNTYWSMPWALGLRAVEAAGLLRIYFMRYMQIGQPYPAWVRPIEQAMYDGSDFKLGEHVGHRHYDLCFVGMASQFRASLICHLIESKLFSIDWEWPLKRMEFMPWVERHRRAKMFIEMNGASLGSDRPYQLIRAAPMLRQRNDRRWVHDWSDGVNCIDIADARGIPQPGDLERLRRLLDDPDALQSTYEAGAAFAEEKFSRHARVSYVIDVLDQFGIN